MEEIPLEGTIALRTLARFVDLATDALGAAREEIDALNVYPVPDGDTGTNLHLTVSAARDALTAAREADAGREAALTALARGALLGARGNSGVVLSEMLGEVVRRIGRARADERGAVVMAEALERAADAAYAAVGTPVEGTMLSVARAAADAAVERASDPDARTGAVVTAAAAAARAALARTPEQLDVLARAGVVDAGGRGLCVLLDAAETASTGRRPPRPPRGPRIPVPVPTPVPATGPATGPATVPATVPATGPDDGDGDVPAAGADLHEDGPSYEVMYLLDAPAEAVPVLRERLAALGDSLVVVGGEGLWNVHVHVDDVGAAVEAGIEAGRPHRVRVTHFAEQVVTPRTPPGLDGGRAGRAVVAVAAGPGLDRLFADAGATVVRGGPGHQPSSAEVLAAITGCGASEVVVLANDVDAVRVARAAAEAAEADSGLRVAVIPTEAQVQGLAAMAVHEPGRSFDRDVVEMTATARHVRHGAITVATERAMTMAGPCAPGDVLGMVAGDYVVVGDDAHAVATDVLGRLLAGGGELVTVVVGDPAAAPPDLGERTAAWLAAEHPVVDVTVFDGGQDRYALMLAVE
ncbi:DAK2 domain-containing protein [Nocardioides aquaticus]|nr:DAK2 domain-containing protein [Nocardioides aquaticus]